MLKGAGVVDRNNAGSPRMVTTDGGLPGFGKSVMHPLVAIMAAVRAITFALVFRRINVSIPQCWQGVEITKPMDSGRLVVLID